jgi:hypothetical protein
MWLDWKWDRSLVMAMQESSKGNQMIFQSNGLPLRAPDLVLFGSALPKDGRVPGTHL